MRICRISLNHTIASCLALLSVDALELTRRQANPAASCHIHPTQRPAAANAWFHFPREEVSEHLASTTPEGVHFTYEKIDKTIQASNLEPARTLYLNYHDDNILHVTQNWVGKHPAVMPATYIYIYFTHQDGSGRTPTTTLFLDENYSYNYHSCQFTIPNDADRRQMHVQVDMRRLGQHP